jgi:hypothetical protein
MLDEAAIGYRTRPYPPGRVVASGEIVEILKALGIPSACGSLASVLIAWIKSRASRKVILQTDDKKVLHLEGYSVKEIEKLLPKTTSLTVIDTRPPDKTD